MVQEKNTTEWSQLLPRATQAQNKLSHEALMGNATPDEAYDMKQTNLQFELREKPANMATYCSNCY